MQPSAFFSNGSFYLGPQGEPPLSRTGFIILSLMMAIFTGPAIVLNATVIIVSLMHKQLRQPLNYALVNMAVADLGTALTGGVLSVFNNAQGYFSLGRTGCVMEGFAVSLFGECWLCAVGNRSLVYVKCLCPKTFSHCALTILQSVFFLTNSRNFITSSVYPPDCFSSPLSSGITSLCTVALIAVERMFVVCKPLGQIKFQEKHAFGGIALSWLWSLTWNLPPLFGWGRYELEGVGTSCAPDWHSRDPHNVSYVLAYFVVCFAAPFAIILASYTKLLWTLHQVRIYRRSRKVGRKKLRYFSPLIKKLLEVYK